MESTNDAAFVRQVQVNLMAAAQSHGWFGSGFNWNKRERELALESREALTPERIAHAVDKWWEVKEPTERFDPCRSFPYIVAVCKNKKENPDEPKWPNRNGNSRNGHDATPAAWVRPVAELCAPGELNVYPDILF